MGTKTYEELLFEVMVLREQNARQADEIRCLRDEMERTREQMMTRDEHESDHRARMVYVLTGRRP